MPGLYSDKAIAALPQPLTHLYSVMAYPVTGEPFPVHIDGEGLSVTFSEDWSPHVQADITAVVPISDAQLDALDARKLCRLEIHAGYKYPDLQEDVQPLADLMLNDRRVGRPGNTMKLEASSDETRAQDRKRTDASGVPVFEGVNALVAWAAGWAMYPETPTIQSVVASNFGAAALKDLDLEIGSSWWDLIAEVANRTSLWIYCDETRKWRVRGRVGVNSTVNHHLAVGKNGTILVSDSSLNRDEWANHVIIKYAFTVPKPTAEDPKATEDKTIYGRAYVSGGEFSVNTVGYKMHYETRETKTSQTYANRSAENVLKNLVTRGRELTIEAAAAYWLRPGHTVTVQLSTGAVQKLIVSSITFNPPRGTMTIKTRYPESVTITQGE